LDYGAPDYRDSGIGSKLPTVLARQG